eukprot:tig00000157_g9724.t1
MTAVLPTTQTGFQVAPAFPRYSVECTWPHPQFLRNFPNGYKGPAYEVSEGICQPVTQIGQSWPSTISQYDLDSQSARKPEYFANGQEINARGYQPVKRPVQLYSADIRPFSGPAGDPRFPVMSGEVPQDLSVYDKDGVARGLTPMDLFGGSYVKDYWSILRAVSRRGYDSKTGLPLAPGSAPIYTPDDQTTIGTVFFWIGAGVMAVVALIALILTLRRDPAKRIFHYITIVYLTISMLAYYCMARQQGSVAIWDDATASNNSPYRVFYYARYVEWFMTVPLIILNLCLLAGTTFATFLALAFASMIMVVSGLLGLLSSTGTKWGYFTFAMFCFVPIEVAFVTILRKSAREKSPEAEKTYNVLMAISFITWLVYPVIWVIGEAVHVISVDADIIIHTIADIFSKAIFAFVLLFSTSAIEEASFKNPRTSSFPTNYTSGTIYQGVLENK